MKKIHLFWLALFLSSVSTVFAAVDRVTISSPNKQVRFTLFINNGNLNYSVSFKNTQVILPSAMVFTVDGTPITKQVKLVSQKSYKVNEQYEWRGVHSIALNHCNGDKISIKTNKTVYTLDVRVYNDGVAYQTIVPESSVDDHVTDEATLFNLPAQSTVWYHDLNMHYEGVYTTNKIEELGQGAWLAPPLTYKLANSIYACITEADLKNFPGMALKANGAGGLTLVLANNQPTSYPYKLRYSAEDTLRLLQPPNIKGTITTPWRVVMIGSDLNAMVNNDIVHNLCPPPGKALFPQGLKTEWIKPGRAVWKYLNGGGDGTVDVMKHFTDGAAQLGFEHNILEGFWSRWTDAEIRDLVNYSSQKGIGIWVWKHSKTLRNPLSRDSFFLRCHTLGIAGVKIDFFDSEAKEVIDLYQSILKETAKYHLMVDFHGANKPTGQARTYPNEMVREAVKGMEASKLSDRATHETTLPFTRFLAGPAEYTVVHLGARKQNTTWAHQLASAAILSAPMLTYAANPDTLLSLPQDAIDVIKFIPGSWDETIVLPASEIGKLAAFARRKGNAWVVAVMNGVGARSLDIPLTFLKGSCIATAVKDGKASDSILTEKKQCSTTDTIHLNLVSGGGFIAKFSK